MSGPERSPPPADLPDGLHEQAADRLLGVPTEARAQALADLVREHPQHATPLRRLAADLAGAERLLHAGFAAADEPLAAIGSYRVLGVIGEGAFGVVYRCAQEVPVRREVAVKVLRPGAGDRRTLARFEAERHVLATLNHATVAQVFDAGSLPDGRPYFVMEYVRGAPITSHCDRHCLGVEARLELFVRLCHGVHHAHVQGIVHRDLKPANVLVFEQDGRPQPKIIDFGIAKALDATDRDTALHTQTGHVIGTPGYMSPEQAASSQDEVDARADVFSLGVILYELLTGELPWGRRPTTTDSEPPRPSSRVATDQGTAARLRALPPRKLVSRLRGDLDWIVLRAIARDRERRFASARELAQDLERHLRGEPVLAGPPALGYRLRKFVRRRRSELLAVGSVVIVAALGLWASLHLRAEVRAKDDDIEAVAAGLLARVNDKSVVNSPQSTALRKALIEEGVQFYERRLQARPADAKARAGRVRALMMLAQLHWALGQWERSAKVAREATGESEALLATDQDNLEYRGLLGNALRNLGRASFDQGQAEAARAELGRAVAELELCHARSPATYSHALCRALLEWATTLGSGSPAACADALRRAVAIQEEAVEQQPSPAARLDLLDALTSLGRHLTRQDELLEAQRALRRADELLAATPEAGNQYACTVLGYGAELAQRKGNYPAAISRMQQAIAFARRWCEIEPDWSRPWGALLDLQRRLAILQYDSSDVQAAAETMRAAIALGDQRIARFPDDLVAGAQLADLLITFVRQLVDRGQRDLLAEAEDCARRAVRLFESLPESVDLRTRAHARLQGLHHLGLVLDAHGSAGARAHWEEVASALVSWRDRFGVGAEDATMFVQAWLRVARHRFDGGEDQDAGEALDRVEALFQEHAAAIERPMQRGAERHRLRALLAARQGVDVRAAQHAERALAAGEGWPVLPIAAEAMRAAWQAGRTGDAAARARASAHRDRAIELHRAAVGALLTARVDPFVSLWLNQSRARLAELLMDAGEKDQAWELLDEALPALTELRDVVHADCWDEALYVAGKAIVAR